MTSLGTAKSSQAFRTIAEASDELDVPAHVLRFWEGKFTQIKPLKRAGGRRHYRPDDMALLRGIRALLQEDGYQIKGVQKLLKDQGIAWVRDRGHAPIGEKIVLADETELSKTMGDIGPQAPIGQHGPLFEAPSPVLATENVSPAAGIMLRKALVKLEKAVGLLDHIAKNDTARTNTL